MNNNINITTGLCAEDRARIDKLIQATESLTAALGNVGTPFQAAVTSPQARAVFKDLASNDKEPAEPLYEEGTGVNDLGFIPIETDEDDEPEAPQEPTAPKHTKAELQSKVVGLVSKSPEIKAKVKAIIEAYAEKCSAIPEDKVDEVWAKLDALEG